MTPALASYAFDIWGFEVFVPLLSGGEVRLPPKETVRDVERLVGELCEADAVHAVPALMREIVARVQAGPGTLPRLRRVYVGGDAVPPDLIGRMRAVFPSAGLWVLYGPTEASILGAAARLRAGGSYEWQVAGRALPGVGLYVCDAWGGLLPAGVAGELWIGGAGVARGYLGRAGLTAERFVPDPYGEVPGARAYRTGDRVRWRADGELEFLGRIDQQVKIRGFRIEPGEVEAVLLGQAGVAEGVVAVREDAPGQKRLVAYVVPREGVELAAAELEARLRKRLPEHMVPGAIVLLERLPLNANGKVDRRALPAPERKAAAYVAPRTATEEVLAAIWAVVLGVERVGTGESFFELGGHSLLATQVVSRARQAFGVEVPLRALFEAPTVAELAGRIEALRRTGPAVAPPIEPVSRAQPLPLSFAQQRLWLVDRIEPGSPAYNMPFALRLRGALDADALRASLDALVRRHETLRTTFAERGGEPVQVIHAPAPVALPVVDLRGVRPAEREAGRLAAEEALRPFDLARGPLLRGALLRLGGDDHVLCLNLHHIVSDGWSMGVLVREVSALHAAFSRGEAPRLPELPVQYADFAVWQRLWLRGETLEAQIGYWKERLRGAPPLLEIPTDRPRAARPGAQAASHAFAFPPRLSERVRELSRGEGATLFMTLLAGWQALLARYAGQDDVVVGSPIAGRTQRETEGLIGFFVNMLALRVDLSGDPTWTELLGRARETALGAYAHQELPFERLVDELGVERSLTHDPVFQAAVSLNGAGGGGDHLRLGRLEVEPFGSGEHAAKFDLSLVLGDSGGALGGVLAYRTALFDAPTIARMAAHLEALLESMASAPARRISDTSLLREDERAQLLGGSRAEPVAHPPACVHELFSAQAARTPGLPALAGRGGTLTYAELERRSDQLAHRLRSLGVRPETRVGLFLERGPEAVVAVLGVLKAGGAYVPMDPDYPAEHLAYTLADSGVAVLLARSHLLGRIPAHAARVLCLDRDPEEPAHEREGPPRSGVGAGNAAYVIYTSGSTGRPKGVVVEHAALANTLLAARETFGPAPGEVTPALASYAFDIWGFEVFVPLLSGGEVRLPPKEAVQDVERLAGELCEADAVHAVPALMREIVARVQAGPGTLPRLRRVYVGGDAVPPDLIGQMREVFPSAGLWVLYGPTEASILGAAARLRAGESYEWQVAGRALPGVGLYVCDAWGGLLPVGVAGELWIGGAGVARGYLGRAGLTAERFVPDPYGEVPGARAYRTGDRVRWRADGELEFLGRIDQQVKIRGFRIEPGEIEAALRDHPSVREAVVAVRDAAPGAPGQKRLVAYVVPEDGGAAELWPSIGEYHVYDEMIYQGLTHDTLRNARYLRALQRHAPGRVVLDVGTGMDAILARLAVQAGARHVYAVELLERSYLAARGRIRELGLEDRVTVIHGDARTVRLPEPADVCVSEIVEAIAGGEGAAAILNQARRLMAPGGVMIPALAQTCMAAVTLPEPIRREPAFSRSAAHYVEQIFEEVGHPCDVRLCIKDFPWQHRLSGVALFEELDFGRGPVPGEYLRVEELRVERAGRLDGLLLWLRMELAEGEILDTSVEETAWFPVYFPLFDPGLEVEAGDRLRVECRGEPHPTRVAPNYSARGALVRRGGEEVPFEFVSDHHVPVYRHTPFYRRLFAGEGIPVADDPRRSLPGALRAHLAARLPEHMVPGAFVTLERLPLSANGKVDRRALPAPRREVATHVGPRTVTEEVLAGTWAEVLGIGQVGVEENFFELGGHSLLATRVVSRVRQAFGVEVPLRVLFEAPTVAALAGRVEALRSAGAVPAPPLVRVPRTGPLPPSFAQQRLWLVDRIDPDSPAYNMAFALRLRGALDADALRSSLGALVRRHETLRTTFAERGGEPVQVIHAPAPVALPVVDLRGVRSAEREAGRLAAEEALRPFDLARGPLLRGALLRLGGDDHVLCLNMHHVVSDGWSMQVLVREVSALYDARSRGGAVVLPELPVQYADFAVWQRAWLAGETLEAQIGYWKERLRGAPPLLEIPTDRPRAVEQSPRAASHPILLPAGLSQGLRELSRREGTTLFMTLLAGWQALLGRYAGQDDVVVGTPIAGRGRREVEGLIGFFVNLLALRADLSADPTWTELLGRVREAALGAYDHQELPFEKLVEELEVERSLAHSPLFQAVFTLSAADGGEPTPLGDLAVEPFGGGADLAKFDLDLGFQGGGAALAGVLQYRAALFDAETVARMAGHLEALLGAMASTPGHRLSELSLLRGEEREQVLHAWNATARAYPRDLCLHETVAAQARRTPGAPAVVAEGRALTYAELDADANRLAHLLRRHGVGPETRVVISLERSPGMVLAILGVLKAGGAYVPLDPAYPAERAAYVLADSGAALVLTEARLAARFATGGVPSLALDALRSELAAEPAGAPGSGVTPDNLAYVIYTSGSTGQPKGVLVQHRSAVNLMYAARDFFGLTPRDRVLQFHSLSFDVSVEETFMALLAGAVLVLRDEEMPGSAARFFERCAEWGVTVLELPTAYWHELVAGLDHGEARLPACVRLLVVGGERMLPERVAQWRRRVGDAARLVNAYGPTEASIASTFAHVGEGVLSIGGPLANVRAYVLEPSLEPAPVGVPGELWIGGAGVARGYLGRPEATAERFTPDPFRGDAGARMYRSGDRVRWLATGELEYLGRIDAQVKVRGFRIEPGEVEAAMREHAAVRDAVVVVRAEEQRLAAYVVPEAGVRVSAAELRAHLAGRLPEYMVPGAFVLLDALPLTVSGKVDRRALPTPGWETEHYVAPRTAAEEVLAGIWAEVLRAERVGVEQSFFELGGHSLLAMRVVSRVREAFGVELPLRALFESPTVAALAGRIEALRGAGPAAAPPIEPVSRALPLPLSFAQQRLWLVDRIDPGSPAYNMATALRLRGALDADALRASLDALVRRHETLRTTFAERRGRPVQVIHPPAPVPLPVIDLGRLPAGARERAAEGLAGAEAMRPFDLARGPLLRSALVRLGETDHVLCFNVHHVVSDGWSMQVLVREVSAVYAAARRGEPAPLEALPVQYADYAVWQRSWLAGETLEAQLGYWKERLAGAPPLLEIPTDRPRAAGLDPRAEAHGFRLTPELSRRLRALSRGEGTTLFMTLLAGWQALLGRWAGQDDVVVGSAVAGRNRGETEGLIGFFVNVLALRADLSGDPTWAELLGRTRETALGAYDHQELPFEKLVEELSVERSLTHSPVFQTNFTLDVSRAGDERLELGDLGLEPFGSGARAAKFDLDLLFDDGGEALAGTIVYRPALFDAATVGRMAAHLEVLLEAMAAGPRRRTSELSLLTGAERAQLLEEWNATAAALPRACFHETFAEQAARTPEAPAVDSGAGALTYGGLEHAANRLANHLRRRGVGPETRVAVCLERGAELAIALLGVLKAGGAYVPLDPAYPAARLAFVLADSGASLLLTRLPLLDRLPAHAGRTVCLDADGARIAAESPLAPDAGVLPENLAYVIYTSGSTGTPKGVLVPHLGLAGVARAQARVVGVGAGDRLLQFASPGFDASVSEMTMALASGGTLVAGTRETLAPGPDLLRFLREAEVSAAILPPAALAVMGPEELPALRTLMAAGEACPARVVERWAPGRRFFNLYGPTEATICATAAACAPGGGRPPIGRPLANTTAYVLDARGEPVPVGVPGELYVGGVGVARGYGGRPELTAERFLPDRFGEAGARLYRTGDRVRWLASGELEFLGRMDAQVKVRGYRIEPGEVESVLRGQPGVADAVVVVREDVPGDRRIVAYLVPRDGAEPSPVELRGRLAERLPEYMLPGRFVTLERIPLTPNGKLDRRALPRPEASGSGRAGARPAPRDGLEATLVHIFEKVLGATGVGLQDSFFELGGHSLLAVQLMSELHEAAGVLLPVTTLFRAPTVEGLAGEVRLGGAREAPVLVPLRAEGSRTPLFLVHPGGGNLLAYAALVRRLGREQPVWGVRSRGIEEGEVPNFTVEEMARDYLARIREKRPSGAYRLGGWSMGGVIAFEMARQLEAAGEEVEKLLLIDSQVPSLHVPGRSLPGDELAMVRLFAHDLGLGDGPLPPLDPQAVDGGEAAYLRQLLQAGRAAGRLPGSFDVALLQRLYGVFRINLKALHEYRPESYGGSVTLLRAGRGGLAGKLFGKEAMGWGRVVRGGVEARVVPGTHFSMVREPGVEALARELERALA